MEGLCLCWLRWDAREAVALGMWWEGEVVERRVAEGAVNLAVGEVGQLLQCVRGGVVSVVEARLVFIRLEAHGR